LHFPETRERGLGEALAAFLADDPLVTPFALGSAAGTHSEQVLGAFERYLKEGRDADRRRWILYVWGGLPGGDADRRIVGVARALLKHHPEQSVRVAEFLESRLYRVGDAAARPIVAFAESLLRHGSADVRRPLIYFAASLQWAPSPPNPPVSKLQRRLLAVVLEREDNEDNLSLLLAQSCAFELPVREPVLAERVVRTLRDRLDSKRFDSELLEKAYRYNYFAPVLAGWLLADEALASGSRTRRLRNLLLQGVEPTRAVARARR